jgi:hypothetical protein
MEEMLSLPNPKSRLLGWTSVGPNFRDRDRVYRAHRYYDRDDDWRYRHGYYPGGPCRDVTVRKRRGDEVGVRHVRRCD